MRSVWLCSRHDAMGAVIVLAAEVHQYQQSAALAVGAGFLLTMVLAELM